MKKRVGDVYKSRNDKDHQQQRKLEDSLEQIHPHSLERPTCWHPDLSHPGSRLWDNKFVLFKPLHLWCFVRAATGNEFKQYLANQTEWDSKCFHCIRDKNRIIIHSFFYENMLLPLTQNSLMNPLPNNSVRSLGITVAPSSLSSCPWPSNSISISLVSQDSFRTSLPPISLHPLHFPTLQCCHQKPWPGHLLPFHVTCLTPAPTSLYCLGESSSGTNRNSVGPLGLILQLGSCSPCFLHPLPQLFSPKAMHRLLQWFCVCLYHPFNEQKCVSCLVCLLNS